MTARDVIAVLIRRWYLLLAAALISLGVLAVVVASQKPVYYTRFDVMVLPPRNTVFPNNIEDPHYAMAPLAGVLVNDVAASHRAPLLGSPDTTLYGQGIRSGWQLRLPNTGSQWQPIYDLPNIDVQVVDSSPEQVRDRAEIIQVQLQKALDKRQDALDIAPGMRASLLSSPHEPAVVPVGGSRMRMLGGLGLVTGTVGILAVCLADRVLRRGVRRA